MDILNVSMKFAYEIPTITHQSMISCFVFGIDLQFAAGNPCVFYKENQHLEFKTITGTVYYFTAFFKIT